jgi:hypothetical protein
MCLSLFERFFFNSRSRTTNKLTFPFSISCINKNATNIPAGFTGPIWKVDGTQYLETTSVFANTLLNQKFQFKVPNCFVVDGAHKAGLNCFEDTNNGDGCRSLEFYAQAAKTGQHQAGRTQEISHDELVFACCGPVRAGAVAQTWTTGGNAMRRTNERKSAYW